MVRDRLSEMLPVTCGQDVAVSLIVLTGTSGAPASSIPLVPLHVASGLPGESD